MVYYKMYNSPLGEILMSSDGSNLTGLWFTKNDKYFPVAIYEEGKEKDLAIFKETKKWLDIYFDGEEPDFTPEMKFDGTDFQNRVFQILLEIPFGVTATYGDIARIIAKEQGVDKISAQAVGNAVGHNPISIIVPCHRVIGADGDLTGYAGGLKRKKQLLQLEGSYEEI